MEMAKYKLGDIVTLLNGRAYLMPELQDSGKYRQAGLCPRARGWRNL